MQDLTSTNDSMANSVDIDTPSSSMSKARGRVVRRTAEVESLDSPGIVPAHQIRSVTAQLPLLEILQRLIHHIQPAYTLETILALIALWKAAVPASRYVASTFKYLFTSEVQIYETDSVAREVLAYISNNVMMKGTQRSAMIVSGSRLADPSDEMSKLLRTRRMSSLLMRVLCTGEMMSMQRTGRLVSTSNEVHMLPPVGMKLFW
jgi:chaperone BCS1